MRVVVTQEKPEPVEPIRHTLLGLGLECSASDCVTFADLPVRLAQGPAELLLVRVGASHTAAIDAIRQAQALTPAPVLALGPASSGQQILDILHGGAREYLDEGRLQPMLEAALEKLQKAGVVRRGQGFVAAVLSPTAGSGVTTVAVNLAFSWAQQAPNEVALVELSRDAVDLALTLDLNPAHTVDEVAQNWERVDAAMLRQCMTSHAGGVQVLAYRPETLAVEPVDPQAVRKVLILLRTMYRAAALDLGHQFGDEHFEALRLCDTVVVVVRLDVPALRQARRLLRLLAERGVPRDRITLVANRYGQRGQLAWKKAEEAIGGKFAEYIPDDSGKVNQALNHGLPLYKVSRYGIARAFAKLAAQLNGQPR
jgi:pilus assembly protein CpaE